MFEFQCVNTESWKLKFEICIWNVWNLKIWELKCLNWDVWIQSWKLKFEIWNLYVKRLEFEKIEMFEFGYVNTEIWNLKNEISPLSHCWTFGVRMNYRHVAKVWKIRQKRGILLKLAKALQCVIEKFIEHFDGFCKKWR